MLKQLLTGATIALGAALLAQPALIAQQGGCRPVMFPTKEQFAASAEAQKHVEAARKLAGSDLQKEFANTCSSTGPQRAAPPAGTSVVCKPSAGGVTRSPSR